MRAPKIVDPINLDYAKGMLAIIQSRKKCRRSINDHSGTKAKKQLEEIKQFKDIFTASKMSDDTLKSWFKVSYDMIFDFYAEIALLSKKQEKLTGSVLSKQEKEDKIVLFLQRGLDMPHPTIGIVRIIIYCTFLLA